MKRTALLVTAALVAVTPAVASAAPAKGSTRTLTATYQGFAGLSTAAVNTALTACPANQACFDFTTKKGEKTVTITAVDQTGTPVPLQIYTDDDYNGTVQAVCGTGTVTVSPKAATPVNVRVVADPTCGGVATQGTLTAVISNR